MKRKNNKGITLISLVITIIVILILASVSITLIFGENNELIGKAKEGANKTNEQIATEKINLKITNSQMHAYAGSQRMPTLQELADDFCEDNEIQYVTLESKKIASLEKIDVGEATSIFTKLKEYPYEFEINSSLQLASIDGVKLADTSTTSTKVLFDGEMSTGTITFNENKIDDYDYYEFIFGINAGASGRRIFSQIVSKEFLKSILQSKDWLYIGGTGGAQAMVVLTIENVSDNAITFSVDAAGTSWQNAKGYIFKIIGRNM